MAKSVTMEEATAWIKANEHRTWSHRRYKTLSGEDFQASLQVKYFYLSFDTRYQKVFHIKTDKSDLYGSHIDEHDSVLTALEARLNGEKVMDRMLKITEEIINAAIQNPDDSNSPKS